MGLRELARLLRFASTDALSVDGPTFVDICGEIMD